MSVSVQQLVNQVLHLPDDKQDEFMKELFKCYNQRYTEEEEREFFADLKRRVEQIDRGEVEMISEEEAMRQLRQRFG